MSQNNTVESRYVVPPFSVKVSGSRTGQDVSILKMAPYFMSKGEGEQVAKFIHQVGFGQTLGTKVMVSPSCGDPVRFYETLQRYARYDISRLNTMLELPYAIWSRRIPST